MDRAEFIERIAQRQKMSEEQKILLKQDYFAVLEDDIDFDKLYQTYLEEYQSRACPAPAWFKQRAKKRIVKSTYNCQIRDLLVVLPSGNQYLFGYEYPMETEKQAIDAIINKFRGKMYKLYRIVKKQEFDENGEDLGVLKYEEEILI